MASLLDILEERQIRFYKHGSKKDEIRVCCPFCIERGESPDTRFRLGINVKTGRGGCFNCKWGSVRHAPRLLAEKLGSDFYDPSTQSTHSDEPAETGEILLPEGFELFDPEVSYKDDYWTNKAWKYISKRLPNKQIKKHNVGYTMAGKMHHRIIFPVIYRKELVGLVCRDFTKTAKAKYLNSSGEKYLYNLPYRPTNGPHRAILSEGIFKALAIERNTSGEVSAAMLGHSLTGRMIKQLKEGKYKRITLFSDPVLKDSGDVDKAGIRGIIQCAQQLTSEGFKVYVIWPIPEKQADEYDDETLKEILKNRKRFNETLANKMLVSITF